jgi:hypothetical protein
LVALARMRWGSSAVPVRAVLASLASAKAGRRSRAEARSVWVRAVQVRRPEASSASVSLGRVSWASARLESARAVLGSSVTVKAALAS